MQTQINSLIKKYDKTHEFLGEGRSRKVFIIDDLWIIKVPLNEEGIHDQYWVLDCFEKNKAQGIYAQCYLKIENEIPLLIMERVKPFIGDSRSLPKWVQQIDYQQVGYTKDGRLVAYDYGWN